MPRGLIDAGSTWVWMYSGSKYDSFDIVRISFNREYIRTAITVYWHNIRCIEKSCHSLCPTLFVILGLFVKSVFPNALVTFEIAPGFDVINCDRVPNSTFKMGTSAVTVRLLRTCSKYGM